MPPAIGRRLFYRPTNIIPLSGHVARLRRPTILIWSCPPISSPVSPHTRRLSPPSSPSIHPSLPVRQPPPSLLPPSLRHVMCVCERSRIVGPWFGPFIYFELGVHAGQVRAGFCVCIYSCVCVCFVGKGEGVEFLQYDSAEWEPAFLRQAREFPFLPLLPREASE